MAIPLNVALFALVGAALVGLFGYGIYRFKLINASERWVPTMGQVTEAHVHQSRRVRKGRAMDPYPVLHYDYSVNSRTFHGSRISFAPTTSLSLDWVTKYPAGTPIQVYYDPQNPGNAVLLPGRAGIAYAMYELPEATEEADA